MCKEIPSSSKDSSLDPTAENVSKAEGVNFMKQTRMKLIGTHIKVHIKNLIEPKEDIRVRELDLLHVSELEKQFQNNHLYTTLIGSIKDCTIEGLDEPGKPVVQVIGGNHCRQALTNILGNLQQPYVYMDIYKDLDNNQSLRLGLQHNDMHRYSKANSFEELVKLFRKLHKTAYEKHKTTRKPAVEWRKQIAIIMNMTKEQSNNAFKVHCHLAALGEDVWTQMENVFVKWKSQEIMDQPAEQIKQNNMVHLSMVKSAQKKIELLSMLASRKLTYATFVENCKMQGKKKKDAPEESTTKPSTSNAEKKKSGAQDQGMDEVEEDDVDDIEDCLPNITNADILSNLKQKNQDLELKNKALIDQLKQAKGEEEYIKQLEDALEKKKEEMKRLKENLNAVNSKYQEQIKSLKEQLHCQQMNEEDLKQKLQYVEEVAARARAQLKSETSNKGPKGKVNKGIPLPKIANKKQAQTSPSSECSGPESEEVNKDIPLPSNVNKKQAPTSPSSECSGPETEEMEIEAGDILLVEYTKGTVYFGIVRHNLQFSYCQFPVLKEIGDKKIVVAGKTFKYETEKYKLDKKYVICKVPESILVDEGKYLHSLITHDELQNSVLNAVEAYTCINKSTV